MAQPQSRTRTPNPGSRPVPTGRPSLIPDDPLPGWRALLQAAILLGLPIALLLIARLVLRAFFPQLGY